MCHVALSLATREMQSLVRGCPHPGCQLGTSVCCFRDECAFCPATRGKHGYLPWATLNSHTTIQTLDPAAVQGLEAEDMGMVSPWATAPCGWVWEGHTVPCAGPGSIQAQSRGTAGWSEPQPQNWRGGTGPAPQAGVPQLSFSLFKVFHSCWAMIRGEAWLSLITAALVLQTAGRQTAG